MFERFFYALKINFTILILLRFYVMSIFAAHTTYKIMIYISYISAISISTHPNQQQYQTTSILSTYQNCSEKTSKLLSQKRTSKLLKIT